MAEARVGRLRTGSLCDLDYLQYEDVFNDTSKAGLGYWGDNDSCSVYGTGRIHCESSLSVNYHRAINRAEKEPLDDEDEDDDGARSWELKLALLFLFFAVVCLWVG
ncbi:Hypothetical predicted protein [Xyrichtys novacula]|uniref:Uncharacterized protein n=1 Tax=Xyrichtys novacula TaxID=13765 RepID=A0AAV1F1L1_XYRNO|nr:Hypothetical predicted protein [Xyrichtys novacula]